MNDTMKLVSLLETYSVNKTIIISFCNKTFLKKLNIWTGYFNALKLSNLLIISLDKKTYRYLKKKNIPTHLVPCKGDRTDIFILRVGIFKQLIHLGYTFIHSDLDAFWLKDPCEKYFYNQPDDFIFSPGTIWPNDIHKKWGFVLCCGLFYARSNKYTEKVLNEVYIDVQQAKNDQSSFNRIIDKDNLKWIIDNKYFLSFNGKRFLCSKSIIKGIGDKLSVSVLPHALFQRVSEDSTSIYVKHLIDKK